MPTSEPTTVVVVDDHLVFAESLESALSTFDGIDVVGAHVDPSDALSAIQQAAPDIVIADYRFPDIAGHELIERIVDVAPDTHVVVLSAIDDPRTIQYAKDAGAAGFVAKAAGLDALIEAIGVVSDGSQWFPVDASNSEAVDVLTAREMDVVRALSGGATMADAGAELEISPNTVRNHLQSAKQKLGVSTRDRRWRGRERWACCRSRPEPTLSGRRVRRGARRDPGAAPAPARRRRRGQPSRRSRRSCPRPTRRSGPPTSRRTTAPTDR